MSDQIERNWPPRHSIVRLAVTPATDPNGTVICEGHQCTPDRAGTITPLAAIQRSTRFALRHDPDRQTATATGHHLPAPLTAAMPESSTGALHIWCWADENEPDPFLSWFFPHVTVQAHRPGAEPGQTDLDLVMRAAPVPMLPYLARLPSDERPTAAHATTGPIVAAVWPVDALPEITCQLTDPDEAALTGP